jgi:CheY-like chemotaxis protein
MAKLKILIVDNEAEIRSGINRILRNFTALKALRYSNT